MSSFPILDLVIGMIFIYFLLSIICSSGVELWLSIRKTRAKILEQWLKTIFNTQALDSHGVPIYNKDNSPVSLGQAIMDHCMVTGLSKTSKSTTYIDAENFVSALLDKITLRTKATSEAADYVQPPPTDLDGYIGAITESKVISGEIKRTILIVANEAKQAVEAVKSITEKGNITTNITTEIKSDIDHFRERLERWYDTNNDRLTGKFKRTKVLPKTILVAVLITVALNVDTVEITKYLYTNQEVSKQFADYAMDAYPRYKERVEEIRNVEQRNDTTDTVSIETLNNNLNQVKQNIDSLHAALPPDLPFGWKNKKSNDWAKHIPGWLATILAITMGAPFWFDILNKISNLRSSGPKPLTAVEKADKK